MTGFLESKPIDDKKSFYWVLVTRPFCTEVTNEEVLYEAYQDQTEVHLSIDNYDLYRKLLGKKVFVKGELYSSHTAHHRRNVLLLVRTIRQIK